MSVNVLITVNAELLIAQHGYKGTEDTPVNIGSYGTSDAYVAMIAQNNVVLSDDGGSELTIKVNSNDTINWSINTFDNMTNYSVSLYGGTFSKLGSHTVISDLTYASSPIGCSLPSEDADNPLKLGAITRYENQICTASGRVVYLPPGPSNNKINYTMKFKLENSSGTKTGYFTWDPFIKITPLNS